MCQQWIISFTPNLFQSSFENLSNECAGLHQQHIASMPNTELIIVRESIVEKIVNHILG